MLEQMKDQLTETMKPVAELAELNLETLKTLSEKQSELFTTLFNGSVSFAKTATEQKDITSFAEAQKEYFTACKETISDAAKESYTVISDAQSKAGEMFKSASKEISTKVEAVTKEISSKVEEATKEISSKVEEATSKVVEATA